MAPNPGVMNSVQLSHRFAVLKSNRQKETKSLCRMMLQDHAPSASSLQPNSLNTGAHHLRTRPMRTSSSGNLPFGNKQQLTMRWVDASPEHTRPLDAVNPRLVIVLLEVPQCIAVLFDIWLHCRPYAIPANLLVYPLHGRQRIAVQVGKPNLFEAPCALPGNDQLQQ